MKKSTKISLFSLMLVIMCSVMISATTYNCTSCSDCSNKIQNAAAGDIIQLTADLSNVNGNCIEFNSTDDIIFDCQGYHIDGDGDTNGYGIHLNHIYLGGAGSDNNIIKNCYVTDFNRGIYIERSNNNIIKDSTTKYNIYYGIELASTINNTLMNIISQENTIYDISFSITSNSNCNNNFINVTGSGNRPIEFYNYAANIQDKELSELILCNADNSTINNVTIRGSDTIKNNLISILMTQNTTFSNINSFENKFGIILSSSNNNIFTDIMVNDNYNDGMWISSSFDNTLTNIIANNNHEGMFISSSFDNTLTNIIANNNSRGIYLSFSSNNTFANSYIKDNTIQGIAIGMGESNYNLFYNNYFNNAINYYNFLNSTNYFNTTNQTGPNIMHGLYIGGNYWANPSGTGFSETCNDTNNDGFCDSAYALGDGNYDYLPLIWPTNTWESKLLFTWDEKANNNPTVEILDTSDQKPSFSGTLEKFSIKLVVTLGRNLDAGDGIECQHCETAACSDTYVIGSATETSTPLNTEATYYINSTDSALLARIEHDGVDSEYLNCYIVGDISRGDQLTIDTYVNLDYKVSI